MTSLSDAELPDGQVRISRPAGHPSAKGSRGRTQETQQRALDLSDPRIVEPWLDNTLVGAQPPAFVVLIVGATAGGKGVLDGSGEDRQRFLGKVRKTVTLFAESARAVRDDGHLVVVGPPETAGEGRLTAGRPAADRPHVPRRAAFPARFENDPRLPPRRARAGRGA